MIVADEGAPADALLGARLCGYDVALGGMVLRGGARATEAIVAALSAALPVGTRIRRLPVHVDEDQLDGGLDLADALAGLGARRHAGLLDGGGLLIVPMAERLSARIAARLAAAIGADRLIVVALDSGEEASHLPTALTDRLAFRFDLDLADAPSEREGLATVANEAMIEALGATAAALGIASARADLLALRAARAMAALAGRAIVRDDDLAEAVRLVLAHRATRFPVAADNAEAPPPEQGDRDESEGQGKGEARELADRVIAAAAAAIDPALLAAIDAGQGRRGDAARMRGAGERRRTKLRGRPIGTRAGDPRGGGRLALIETLRTAAPWQKLRGRTDRVLVRKGDLRIYRREARAETVAIFAVDASGSAAAARLAEAKGAVELLLGQAYVQRAEVALAAFRGTSAELLLPPTRSLTRARRALAELPGGGGTPLAQGIEAALGVALAARAKGRTPTIVLLSDGRANIAAGGISAGRAAAERDALAAARIVRVERIPAIFVDTGARARPEGARIAEAMGARYLPLPYAGAEGLSAAVTALSTRAA